MQTTDTTHSQLKDLEGTITRLKSELKAQTAKESESIHKKLAVLRAQRDLKRLEITSKIGAAMASGLAGIANAEKEYAASVGDSKTAAQARVVELKAEIEKLRQELRAAVAAVALSTGEEIAVVDSKAKGALKTAQDKASTYIHKLSTQRDAFVKAANQFADAKGAEVQGAMNEFSRSVRDLSALRSHDSPAD